MEKNTQYTIRPIIWFFCNIEGVYLGRSSSLFELPGIIFLFRENDDGIIARCMSFLDVILRDQF